MSKWQAVVFDLDDTLYPERDYVLSGFRAVAEWAASRIGLPVEQGYNTLHNLFMSGVRGNTFNLWLEQHGASPTLVPNLVQIYRSHVPNISPFPEVRTLLQRLSMWTKIGLLSDGYLDVQQKKWRALGLAAYFDVVTFSDQWGRKYWKPNIKPFIHTQSQLNVENIVYVGDNPTKDFYGARLCGWNTIWIQREGAEYANSALPGTEYAPDLTIYSLENLELALEDLDKIDQAS